MKWLKLMPRVLLVSIITGVLACTTIVEKGWQINYELWNNTDYSIQLEVYEKAFITNTYQLAAGDHFILKQVGDAPTPPFYPADSVVVTFAADESYKRVDVACHISACTEGKRNLMNEIFFQEKSREKNKEQTYDYVYEFTEDDINNELKE